MTEDNIKKEELKEVTSIVDLVIEKFKMECIKD